MRLLKYLCLIVVCVWTFLANQARAEPEWIIGQPSDELRFTDLSLGAVLDGGRNFGFGFSPGVLMGVPVVDGGFIRPINDSFFIEAGLFVSARFDRRREDYVWVIPEIGPRWNFHLTPRWDVFATIKLGWAIGEHGDFWVRGTVGTQWWFVRNWSLRAETAGGALAGPALFLGLSYRFM